MKRYLPLLAIVLGLGAASSLPALLRGGVPCAPCAGFSCPAPEVFPIPDASPSPPPARTVTASR